jgi:signal transduction histidine kinase/streptogramin lyase
MYLATTSGLARAALPKPGEEPKLEFLPTPSGLNTPRTTSVWLEPAGAIWYGCGTTICRMEKGSPQVFSDAAGVPVDQWQYLTKDPAGNLWARSRLVLIELPAGATQFRKVDVHDVAPIYYGYPTLAFDGKGILLAPTNTGLSMLTPAGWKHIGQRQGLPGSLVSTTLLDAEGSLWIGGTGGLARWTGYGQWRSFTESEGLAGGASLSFLEDSAGGIWAGSGGGLSHGVLSGGAWTWKTVGDRNVSWISNLVKSKDGTLWMTTMESQVVRLDPRTGVFQRFGHFDGQPYSIFIDSADNLWVLRTNALYRASAARPAAGFAQVNLPGTTARTVYTRMTQDARGDLWLGSMSGLFRLSNGTWTKLTKADGLSSEGISNLNPTARGDVWIGYRSEPEIDRIYHVDDGVHVERLARSHGLTGDRIYSVREDRSGRVWALTDHGAALRDGDRWVHFDQFDGLLWNDCNTFLSASDGSIWIGTDRGITEISAPTVERPHHLFVKFSEVRLGDQDADPARALVEPQPGAVAVKFTTLDLAHGHRVQYRYRCLGLDNRWIETTRPEVSFDWLRPGRYQLEVQARVAGSEWEGRPAALAFELRPRWFESPLFQGMVITMLCGALLAAWKLRVRHFALARAKLQSEVDARTQELSAANYQLRSEIAERERAAAEKQRLEEELLQARKLESIGRLAGGVAHDFNNLLTVINGHCELLLDRLHEFDPIRTSIQEVRGAGQRAADLTQRLLAFSRKQMLQPKPVSLVETVKGVQAMLRRLVREDIDLITKLRPDSGLVMADRGQIEQVLINLVVNASDAIDGPGRVLIAVQPADIAPGTLVADPDLLPGPYVMLSVSDTGCGMSEATLHHVFEPFFTTKEVGKGTGLGLAMVHGVVKQSGGSIEAQSAPGKGTTFRIYLPRVGEAPAAAASEPAERHRSRGHESILLVEDQEQVRELAVTVLRHAGYTVDNAPDGASGLMLVDKREAPIDLLLTDVVMPMMSGPELANKVRDRSPSTRVLYISGYSPDALNEEGKSEEGTLHLSKPFTPAQLLEQVRRALDQ